ncbi:MAG: hypothetical protein JWO57_4000 [Pseudonocardiales bacterium]|nr:hypothetical protein [Pseudonocardiales bacterium]
MPTLQPEHLERIPSEHLTRGAAAIALTAVAVIHIVDLPSTLQATPVIGSGYFVLVVAAVLAAAMLLTLPGRLVWALTSAIAGGALLAYVLSRTTGLPTDSLDVGNWNCSLGVAAISTESLIVLLAAWRIQPRRPAARYEIDNTLPTLPTVGASPSQY